MDTDFNIYETASVCPVCLKRISAQRITENGETRIVKKCIEHGEFSTPVWRGEPHIQNWARPKIPSAPPVTDTAASKGCPFDCGLCPEHNQHTCTTLIEITWRCDLNCKICFASAGNSKSQTLVRPDPTIDELKDLLKKVRETAGPCNLQLSGGEPAVRDDLPQIATIAKELGFPFVQINTNGLRVARQEGLAKLWADSGVDSAFLQFDGTRDDIYESIRGRALIKEKKEAIKNLTDAGIGVVLVPTIVPGVNDDNIGEILKLAISHSPGIRGVHFQPVSYFGRYPESPSDKSRITLPEIMSKLEEQTSELVHKADFLPPACEHSLCSFHSNYMVMENGKLKKLSGKNEACCAPRPASEGAEKSRTFVRRQWAAPAVEECGCKKPLDDLDRFIQRAKTHILAVSGMAFQDAWTLDLERLRGCCIHVASANGKLIPFCAYNLTSMDGSSLYRGQND
ncbi:radical SAM (seleno)protein TrsS [Maridesulfovibrio ferrireducens]|uniref:radical SAM (seleno)protein TrsS n=1 Tax=Maridesulfovibrio ferrireducens TaxID=246191 RepID=UPI001A34FF00|nr:radical SAM (seleno)protein TrsS [Maridesulfovibrio ferrireducens]MBI9112920.1 radical SAM protein [Maridesulfovibrio ferrireducens]